MIRHLDSSATRFLSDLGETSRRLNKAQREISSGLRLNTAGDLPESVPALLEARAELARTVQARSNLDRVMTEVDTAERALQAADDIVRRARLVGAAASVTTRTAEQHQQFAQELGGLLEQLAGVANTTLEGRYLFSGDADSTAPYTLDLSQSQPFGAYAGAAATRRIPDSGGGLIAVSRTAEEIFDAPGQSLVHPLAALRQALLAHDFTAISDALLSLERAEPHLQAQIAFYGHAQNRVAEAIRQANQTELRLKASLASIEEADLAEAVLQLGQASSQQEAALAARARFPKQSLFDFLG